MNLPRQASIRQEWRQLIRISSVMWQVERFLPKEVAADALSYAVQARYVSIYTHMQAARVVWCRCDVYTMRL
jgi:hypothetical protein